MSVQVRSHIPASQKLRKQPAGTENIMTKALWSGQLKFPCQLISFCSLKCNNSIRLVNNYTESHSAVTLAGLQVQRAAHSDKWNVK